MDIYDQLEQLVPQERKEDFLRLSRQLKEYGDHNPELLRIVEAMGFLSLYTEQLPKRVSDAIEHSRAQLATELKALRVEHLSALSAFNVNQPLIKPRHRHLLFIVALSILCFAGGACFIWNDHHTIQKTIYEHVAARTKDAIARLQPDYIREHLENLKAFLDTGIRVSVERDNLSGDTVLRLEEANGVSLYYPRCADGKYSINVLQ
ncbi:MAG: hypothetical protein JO251_20570 [Verrucomicrobia bacterium]|nr:hypothetical protein [Verrucomicrobiota bacterium]